MHYSYQVNCQDPREFNGQICWGHLTKETLDSPDIITLYTHPEHRGQDVVDSVNEALRSNYFFAKNASNFEFKPDSIVVRPDGMNISELKICLQLMRAGVIRQIVAKGMAEIAMQLDPVPYSLPGRDMHHGAIFKHSGKARVAWWRLMCLGESKDYKFHTATSDIYVAGETVLSDEQYAYAVNDCSISAPGLTGGGWDFPTASRVDSMRVRYHDYVAPNVRDNLEFYENILKMKPKEAAVGYLQTYEEFLKSRGSK